MRVAVNIRAAEKMGKGEVARRSIKKKGGHEVVPAKVLMTGEIREELESDDPNNLSPWEAESGRCQSRPTCSGRTGQSTV